jgi:hypothetical protein
MPNRYEYVRKPIKCPECGSARVAKILYGFPIFSEELEAQIKAGQIILGGCVVTNLDPFWRCTDCKTPIYRKRKTDDEVAE